MILVIAKFEAKPGERENVLAAAAPCIEATRREEGCLAYDLLSMADDELAFTFVEKWTSKEALARHQQTEHIRVFKERRAPYVTGPSAVEVFRVTEEAL